MPKGMKNIKLRKMRGGSRVTADQRGGGSLATDCPPGVVCMSSALSTLLIVVLVAVLAFALYHIYMIYQGGQTITKHILNPVSQQQPTVIIAGGQQGGQDDRYTMAPKPTRFWRAPPDTDTWNPTTLPSVATRGLPESYQTIGLLKYPGGELKPLYGRRTAGSNDRWNYYTRTDTYNPVPVPLKQGRRDCQDDVGCNEVFDGDKLKSLNGEEVGVTLYKMNGPTYIPSV